jgi:hypothetical protein
MRGIVAAVRASGGQRSHRAAQGKAVGDHGDGLAWPCARDGHQMTSDAVARLQLRLAATASGGAGLGVVRQLDGTTSAPVTWDRLSGSSTSAT